MKKGLLLSLILLLTLVLLVGCSSASDFYVFGTTLMVKTEGTQGKKIAKAIYNELDGYESIISPVIEGSDLYRVNKAEKDVPVSVSDMTLELYKISLEMYNLSSHAFNPSVYPIVKLWGFDADTFIVAGQTKQPPTDEQINALLYLTDLENMFVVDYTNKTITKKDSKAMLDFGAVAKGYSLGRLTGIVGDKKSIVDLGGNIIGFNKDYTVGIRSPRDTGSSVFGKFTLHSGESISTSGDYQRYYEYNGTRYHHILDPNTGKPANKNIISVSIISNKIEGVQNGNSAAYIDAISTAVFVLGKDAGKELINTLKVKAVIIYSDLTYDVCGDLDFVRL